MSGEEQEGLRGGVGGGGVPSAITTTQQRSGPALLRASSGWWAPPPDAAITVGVGLTQHATRLQHAFCGGRLAMRRQVGGGMVRARAASRQARAN